MRYLLTTLILILITLPASAGENTAPSGVVYKPSGVITISTCVVAGTDTASVTAGRYEVCAYTEDVYVCEAATCASAGYRLAAGTCRWWRFTATATHSCRSVGSSGDVQFTPYAL